MIRRISKYSLQAQIITMLYTCTKNIYQTYNNIRIEEKIHFQFIIIITYKRLIIIFFYIVNHQLKIDNI
jgi:hypothetical protein